MLVSFEERSHHCLEIDGELAPFTVCGQEVDEGDRFPLQRATPTCVRCFEDGPFVAVTEEAVSR